MSQTMAMLALIVMIAALAVAAFYEPPPPHWRPQGSAFVAPPR